MQEITKFIYSINNESSISKRSKLEPASEACQSITGLIEGIQKRIEWCTLLKVNTRVEQEAKKWISRRIRPYFRSVCRNLINNRKNCSHWRENEIIKIASPSDVGIHNTLKTKDGLYFFDFEYAGLDDLSKLAADWILQPEYRFNKEQEELFCKLLHEKMNGHHKGSWKERLDDIKPLIHIKWCLIMLNQLQKNELNEIRLQKAINYFEEKGY